jgi:hypothetical protein
MDGEEGLGAYSEVQLRDKQIEPDNKLDNEAVNRNLQLGYIKNRADLVWYNHMIDLADKLRDFPVQQGGWLLKRYGNQQLKIMDKQLVLSNSTDGFGRTSLNTLTRNQALKQQDIKNGFFDSLFGKRRN